MWRIAGASIPGSDHTMPGKPGWKNNQDAFFLNSNDDVTIGIVADGCGSGSHSEVGAQIGVQLFGSMLNEASLRAMTHGKEMVDMWERLRMELLGHISVLSRPMGKSFSETVGEYFLFSIVGFIIMPVKTTVFHCGDGMYAVNGAVTKLGPYPKNAPPYLAYGLLDTGPKMITQSFSTDSLSSISVGTDGVDYITDFEQWLNELSTTQAVFSNSDVLRRKLAMMNLEKIQNGMLTPGPLRDDTTLVIASYQS